MHQRSHGYGPSIHTAWCIALDLDPWPAGATAASLIVLCVHRRLDALKRKGPDIAARPLIFGSPTCARPRFLKADGGVGTQGPTTESIPDSRSPSDWIAENSSRSSASRSFYVCTTRIFLITNTPPYRQEALTTRATCCAGSCHRTWSSPRVVRPCFQRMHPWSVAEPALAVRR